MTFHFQITDADVCQVRLDFLDFRIGGPSMATLPYGKCSGDRLAIFAGQNRLGLSEGNLICGDMTGQHGNTLFQGQKNVLYKKSNANVIP